jgi:hypothetical protein
LVGWRHAEVVVPNENQNTNPQIAPPSDDFSNLLFGAYLGVRVFGDSQVNDLTAITQEELDAEESVRCIGDHLVGFRTSVWLLIQRKTWLKRRANEDEYFKDLGFRNGFSGAKSLLNATAKLIGKIGITGSGEVFVTQQAAVTKLATKPKPASLPTKQPAAPIDDIWLDGETCKTPEPQEPTVSRDQAGNAIPACLAGVFTNAAKWAELAQQARNMGRQIGSLARLTGGESCASTRSLVSTKKDDNGRIVQVTCHPANEMAQDIEQGTPHAVCQKCNGRAAVTEDFCAMCGDRGWLTTTQWTTCMGMRK